METPTAPEYQSYVVLNDGKIVLEADLCQEMSFFYNISMFENGQWKERAEYKNYTCVRSDIYKR